MITNTYHACLFHIILSERVAASPVIHCLALLCTVSVVRLIVFRRKPLQAVCEGR